MAEDSSVGIEYYEEIAGDLDYCSPFLEADRLVENEARICSRQSKSPYPIRTDMRWWKLSICSLLSLGSTVRPETQIWASWRECTADGSSQGLSDRWDREEESRAEDLTNVEWYRIDRNERCSREYRGRPQSAQPSFRFDYYRCRRREAPHREGLRQISWSDIDWLNIII